MIKRSFFAFVWETEKKRLIVGYSTWQYRSSNEAEESRHPSLIQQSYNF